MNKLKVFVAHQRWLPMASQHGALQALWSASIHWDVGSLQRWYKGTAVSGGLQGEDATVSVCFQCVFLALVSCGFQLIQCCSDLSNYWWPFESLTEYPDSVAVFYVWKSWKTTSPHDLLQKTRWSGTHLVAAVTGRQPRKKIWRPVKTIGKDLGTKR